MEWKPPTDFPNHADTAMPSPRHPPHGASHQSWPSAEQHSHPLFPAMGPGRPRLVVQVRDWPVGSDGAGAAGTACLVLRGLSLSCGCLLTTLRLQHMACFLGGCGPAWGGALGAHAHILPRPLDDQPQNPTQFQGEGHGLHLFMGIFIHLWKTQSATLVL